MKAKLGFPHCLSDPPQPCRLPAPQSPAPSAPHLAQHCLCRCPLQDSSPSLSVSVLGLDHGHKEISPLLFLLLSNTSLRQASLSSLLPILLSPPVSLPFYQLSMGLSCIHAKSTASHADNCFVLASLFSLQPSFNSLTDNLSLHLFSPTKCPCLPLTDLCKTLSNKDINLTVTWSLLTHIAHHSLFLHSAFCIGFTNFSSAFYSLFLLSKLPTSPQ